MPLGRVVVVRAIGVPAALIAMVKLPEVVAPPASLACAVKVAFAGPVGVPVMAPLAGFKVRPAGSEPAVKA